MHALAALDDRMLADIGIRRSEIGQLAFGKVPRRSEPMAAPEATKSVAAQPEPVPEMKRAA